ncbi:MAG TPA: iron-sulfur cluster assembly protein, partial [Solirubrobacteraceae bacterium]|nr:iron-sulfur cluster assembly protein [Solirubrobacteraceae bacterium]
MPSQDEIRTALQRVIDPELRRSIVELGMVRSIAISEAGEVDVTVSLTTPGCPIRNHFVEALTREAGGVAGVTGVNVAFDVLSDSEKSALQRSLRPA